MLDDESKIKNRSPSKGEIDLERILNQKISIDTDVMDFVLIAGWSYHSNLNYRKGDNELRENIREYVQKKRAGMEKKIKIREGRFVNSIADSYFLKEIKTLRDLKKIIEEKGLKYRGMGCLGLARFNEILDKYGIEPFKLRKKYWGKETLKKYSVKPEDIYFQSTS